MRIWEVIGTTPVQAQEKQLDAEQKLLTQKKKNLKVRSAQDDLFKAIKDRSVSAQNPRESATATGSLVLMQIC